MSVKSSVMAAVVPTRNRPNEIRAMLRSLRQQSQPPDSLIIVDSSDPGMKLEVRSAVQEGWPEAILIDHARPSAAAQRNRGLDEVVDRCDLILLIDDDVTLPENALAKLSEAACKAGVDVIGFGMNAADEDAGRPYGWAKSSKLAEWLGIYSKKMGSITKSGWHTRLRRVNCSQKVDWLLSGAVVWRSQAIRSLRFDEFFEEYSYLEDLEFSLQARKIGTFLIVGEAEYLHSPAVGGRKSRFWFGRIEIRNRLYIVRKHNLSESRFWLGAGIRSFITFWTAVLGRPEEFGRIGGNLVEIARPRQR